MVKAALKNPYAVIVFALAVLLFQYRIVTLESLANWLGVPW